jgi:hypothetical protein
MQRSWPARPEPCCSSRAGAGSRSAVTSASAGRVACRRPNASPAQQADERLNRKCRIAWQSTTAPSSPPRSPRLVLNASILGREELGCFSEPTYIANYARPFSATSGRRSQLCRSSRLSSHVTGNHGRDTPKQPDIRPAHGRRSHTKDRPEPREGAGNSVAIVFAVVELPRGPSR